MLSLRQLVVIGDREFRSVELANWLEQRKVAYVFRQKQNTYIQLPKQEYQPLHSVGLVPGMKLYLTGVKLTKAKGFTQGAIAAYWKRKYRGKQEKQGWYLLTNLSLEEAIA